VVGAGVHHLPEVLHDGVCEARLVCAFGVKFRSNCKCGIAASYFLAERRSRRMIFPSR